MRKLLLVSLFIGLSLVGAMTVSANTELVTGDNSTFIWDTWFWTLDENGASTVEILDVDWLLHIATWPIWEYAGISRIMLTAGKSYNVGYYIASLEDGAGWNCKVCLWEVSDWPASQCTEETITVWQHNYSNIIAQDQIYHLYCENVVNAYIVGVTVTELDSPATNLVNITQTGISITTNATDEITSANNTYLTSIFEILKFAGVIAVLAWGLYVLNKIFSFIPRKEE